MIPELVCSAVALVLYLNTLGADFCYDDSRAIKYNQDLLPETPWSNIFYDDFWGTLLTHSGSHKSYRPLCTLSFRLNHALGGLEPWGYHLVNVTLHAAVTGVFARLARSLLRGRWALAAGLLFAAHPVHTEAVAGVVGRADLGAGLFFLLSLLCYSRHCELRPGPAHSTTNPTPPATNTTPSVTNTTPPATNTTPSVTNTTPPATNTTPSATNPTPSATNTTPPATNTTPSATNPTPSATNTTPSVTNPTPPATNPTPPATNPTPSATNPTPSATNTTPSTTNPTPSATNPTPSTTGPAPHCWVWLLASLLLAGCSMLWKEQGVTVLGVAAAYDLFIFHRLRLRPLLHLLRKRKSPSLLLSLSAVVVWGAVLLAARLYWMGNKPPNFSSSDNPAADSPSRLARTLTFLHLPAANFWLLLCPSTLSFDWSMDAVPLLRSLSDWRNLHTAAFYAGLLLLAHFGLRSPARDGDARVVDGDRHVVDGDRHVVDGDRHVTDGNAHIADGDAHITDGNGRHPEAPHPEPGDAVPQAPSSPAAARAADGAPGPSPEGAVLFSLALLVLPFLPASNLLFYVGFVMAERVLYIPSMGFCLLLALGLRSLSSRLGPRASRSALLGCCAALLLLFGGKTVLRNRDWHSEETLYRSGIAVNPPKAWGNLGNVLRNQGKMTEAERAYRNALYYRSNMADMLYNLGLLLHDSKQLPEALQYYTLAINSRPTLASAYLNSGIILMNQGHLDEAKRTFLTCANIPDENLKDPHAHWSSVTSCLYNLGKLLHEQGHQEEAIIVFKQAVQKMPRQFAPQSLYNMMGEAHMSLHRLQEAEHWYQESLRAKADHIPAHLTYAKLLAIRGRKQEAEQYFLKAIDLNPRKGSGYMHYGQFLLEESRLTEAAEMAEMAAELEIGQFDVVFNSAHMLRAAGFNSAAEKYYGIAASRRPTDPAALMNLGAILHLNGKLQRAEASYLQALQLSPDDAVTQANLRKLRNIMEKQGLKTARR